MRRIGFILALRVPKLSSRILGIILALSRSAFLSGYSEHQPKGLPMNNDLNETKERLIQFAVRTETQAPEILINPDGTLTRGLLSYCKAQNLNLDWLFFGGE